MSNTPSSYDPDNPSAFFDEDYYERAPSVGKGIYVDYHWQPRRSFSEALAIINYLGLEDGDRVLDVGCAKGYLVKALVQLGINAFGCDISQYAIDHCSDAVKIRLDIATQPMWLSYHYDEWFQIAIVRDVLEHNTQEGLSELLDNICSCSDKLLACIPLGDDGKYRIPCYHRDKSHMIAENERWWFETLDKANLNVVDSTHHLPGMKDNWYKIHEKGNMVCLMERW